MQIKTRLTLLPQRGGERVVGTLQYSQNQLDLFDMRGCHFVMLPPLRGDNSR